MSARNTAMLENIEFTNSPPTIDQIPRSELEYFCRCLVKAERKYRLQKLQKEEKAMSEKTKVKETKRALNLTVKKIEEKLAPLSDEEREEVISKLFEDYGKRNREA